MSGMYPIKWKHAKIVPVRKSNGNYRPVAILYFLSKVLEKILCMQTINYIDLKNLLSRMQSGFWSAHSCISALVDASENVKQALKNGDVNFLVLLDHLKTFETIDNNMLIRKLKYTSAKLIHSYLSQRTQAIFWRENGLILYLWTKVCLSYLSLDHFFSPCISIYNLPGYLLNC